MNDRKPLTPPSKYEEIREAGGHFPAGEIAFVIAFVVWVIFYL